MRIVLPEFPALRAPAGGASPRSPRPCTSSPRPPSPDGRSETLTPSPRRQVSVDSQSAPVEYPESTDEPSAIAASMAYRWEIDLSPGGRTRPATRVEGCTTTLCDEGIAEL